MVFKFYGVETDPQQLNWFLPSVDGYTEQGWVYWDRAAWFAPDRVRHVYEDLASYQLIDSNLARGNPVIVRVRLAGAVPRTRRMRSAASNEASGTLSANTNLSRRRIATNSEIWFIISFISSPTQCTNRVLRTGVNSGPACEAERKGALSPRNRGAVKKRKMQVTNTNDVKTASPGLKRVT